MVAARLGILSVWEEDAEIVGGAEAGELSKCRERVAVEAWKVDEKRPRLGSLLGGHIATELSERIKDRAKAL